MGTNPPMDVDVGMGIKKSKSNMDVDGNGDRNNKWRWGKTKILPKYDPLSSLRRLCLINLNYFPSLMCLN